MANKATAKRKVAKKTSARKSVSKARKAAPKKAAPKKAARKTVAVAAARKGGGMRVVVADGQNTKPKPLPYNDRVRSLAEEFYVNDEARDTSKIIIDYTELRRTAIRAMGGDIDSASSDELVEVEGIKVCRGSYATEAEGEALAIRIKKQKKGPQSVFRVNLLDFHVLDGEARLNFRDFSAQDMIERIAELIPDVAVNGIRDPAKAVVRGNLLTAMGGESRWRAAAHAWIFKSQGLMANAPLNIPVILSAANTNDADTALDVVKDNLVKNQKVLEIAQSVQLSNRLGKSPKDIATYMGKSVNWVNGHLAVLGMPEMVLNMIKAGDISVNFAWKAWEQEKHDPARTLRAISTARNLARAISPKSRVGPRHLVKTEDETKPSETKPVGTAAEGEGTDTEAPVTETITTSTRRASNDARLTKVVHTLDMICAVIANAPLSNNEDGTGSLRITVEQIVEVLGPKCGMTVPDWAKPEPDEQQEEQEREQAA
jgi:hypothetical protein